MKDYIIVSDFDGTITTKDTLYHFFETYAQPEWKKIEQDWVNGIISSKECLIKEFEIVPNLSRELVDNYTKTIQLDKDFKEFLDFINRKNIDFVIVSDGIDYFINSVLENHGIKNVKIITNHGEFIDNKFVISFPNDSSMCPNDAGTCKCSIINSLRQNYKTIFYIGDGTSDFCVASKVDYLFAKSNLLSYCKEKEISCINYESFKGVIDYDKFN